MSVSFAVSRPEHEAELWQFLSGVFGLAEAPPNLRSGAMAWKYFDAHPWWTNGRSYTLRAPQGLAAHCCASPVRFTNNGNMVESAQIIDWAAGRLVPASGLLICRRCLEASGGTLLAIGGSEDALRIFPQLKWFTRKDDLRYFARPLRPWRHLAHSAKGARTLARFARNLHWKWFPRLPGAGSWRCRDARPGEEVFAHSGSFVPITRTRAWFDYLLRCPVVKTELVILEQAGTPRGHAFLAHAQGSVRVADYILAGGVSHAERVSAFSALTRYIAAQPDAAEITAASSLQELCGVFEECGLRSRGSSPVYLADPRKLFPEDARLEIAPLIGDAFYFYEPAYPFLC
jgi:hypothetical protein